MAFCHAVHLWLSVFMFCGLVAEAFLTAYQAIALNGRLEDDNAILIHAVSVHIAMGSCHLVCLHLAT